MSQSILGLVIGKLAPRTGEFAIILPRTLDREVAESIAFSANEGTGFPQDSPFAIIIVPSEFPEDDIRNHHIRSNTKEVAFRNNERLFIWNYGDSEEGSSLETVVTRFLNHSFPGKEEKNLSLQKLAGSWNFR